ncbi:sigma factor-like helix-turn-helix DNA-binding protein [Sorangium sp. So ce1036]|uniref:RNA polymerase sigma factor n=1 Tax=Sorangium sp. So ce1036 TaxID=3133328 RepID=UPI003F0E34C2
MSVSFLRRLLRGFGVASSDLEDVLQDVLIAVYGSLDTFDASRLLRAIQGGLLDLDEHAEEEEEEEEDERVPFEAVIPQLGSIRTRRAWSPLYSWLFGIAWRQVSHYRERAYRRRELPMGLQNNPIFAGVDVRPGQEAQAAAKDRAEVVDALLGSLVPQRRVVLVMHDMLDIPVVDIARELKINENTAQNRLRLAREDFQAAVKRLSPEQRSALRLGDRPFAAEAKAPRRPAPRRGEGR